MKCPVCDERMREIERMGVQIDVCPGCKGVWLDRGELDKLLDMAAEGGTAAGREAAARERKDDERDWRDDARARREYDRDGPPRDRYDEGYAIRRRRRGSWLGEILGGLGEDD